MKNKIIRGEDCHPVLPIQKGDSEYVNYCHSELVLAVRERAAQMGVDEHIPPHIVTGIAKADFTDRIAQLKKDRALLSENPAIHDEYTWNFLPIEESGMNNPDDRLKTFLEVSRYMPSFEIAVRIRLGETRGLNPQNTLAYHALHAFAEQLDEAEVVHSEPKAKLRVTVKHGDKVPGATGDFAVIETKSRGMTLAVQGRRFDLKSRETGVVSLDDLPEGGELRRSLMMLGRVFNRLPESSVNERKADVLNALAGNEKYFPVIERMYVAQRSPKASN